MYLGILGRPELQAAVKSDSPFVFAESDGNVGIENPQLPAIGLILEKLLDMPACLLISVQFGEHRRILLAGGAITGCAFKDCRQ